MWHIYTLPPTDCTAKLSMLNPHPAVRGPKNGVTMRFTDNFIKHKKKGIPDGGGKGHIESQTSPRCPTVGPSARRILKPCHLS